MKRITRIEREVERKDLPEMAAADIEYVQGEIYYRIDGIDADLTVQDLARNLGLI